MTNFKKLDQEKKRRYINELSVNEHSEIEKLIIDEYICFVKIVSILLSLLLLHWGTDDLQLKS